MKQALGLKKIKFFLAMASVVFCVSAILVVYSMKASAETSRGQYLQILRNFAADTFEIDIEENIIVDEGDSDTVVGALVADFDNASLSDYHEDEGGKIAGIVDLKGVNGFSDGTYGVKLTLTTDSDNQIVPAGELIDANGEIYNMETAIQDYDEDMGVDRWDIVRGSVTLYYCPPGCACMISVVIY
ncbi:hypothetical protein QUF90_18575 [Desulfococcaceae bacterium HSG9]|nr:hypothetical protein [Desulfococcaceae bacterium HSG9]